MRPAPLLLLLVCGCQTLPHLPDRTVTELSSAPGAWIKGSARGLISPPRILNNEDFIYDAKFSPNSQEVALSRLGMKSFDVLVWALNAPPKQVAEASVNLHEFDVESVEFSPDGKWVAAVSRDGSVRVYDAATGQPAGAWLTEEPLTTVAFHPQGGYLAVGSEKGLITVLKVEVQGPKVLFRFATEQRVHVGQVRALAFGADGRLFSGGWDKTLVVLTAEDKPAASHSAAVHFERKGGFAQMRGTLNDVASVLFAFDARMPQVVVLRSALAQSVGIEPSKLTDTLNLTSSFGNQVARIAHGVRLSFKGLKLENIDAVICDACVPADAQAVLGQGFASLVDFAFDDTQSQAILNRKGGDASSVESLLAIKESKRFTFPAFINDVSIDRRGKVLGVAFSEAKGERTREVYEREKRGEIEPAREWDVGARVDAETGTVLEKFAGHHGVVATAGISPDGATLATGGWDKRVLLHTRVVPVEERFGWAIRRVRFSPDGRWLAVGAWTPQNPLGDHKSDRSAVVWEVSYSEAEVDR
jgi:WD40 repeat protein